MASIGQFAQVTLGGTEVGRNGVSLDQHDQHHTHDGSCKAGPAVAQTAAARPATCPVKPTWIRRIGAAAFLFFLIKGLLWLLVPAGVVLWQMFART